MFSRGECHTDIPIDFCSYRKPSNKLLASVTCDKLLIISIIISWNDGSSTRYLCAYKENRYSPFQSVSSHINIAPRKLLLLRMHFLHKEKHEWECVLVLAAVLKYVSRPKLPSEFWWDILLWKICNDRCLVYLILAGLLQIQPTAYVTLKLK